MSEPREIQNISVLQEQLNNKLYTPEVLRQFTLRGWQHKPECNQTGISCGVRNLVNLGAMTEQFFVGWINRKEPTMGDKEYPENGYTYIFSDDVALKNGERVANMIKRYDLGKLTETSEVKNPNSANYIKIWVWHYNGKKIRQEGTADVDA